MLQFIKKTVILYFILAIAFTSLLTLVYSLPVTSIKKHVATSAMQIAHEGVWWKPCNFYLFQIDNMTDCLMLGTSICDHEKPALKAALLNERATPKSSEVTDYYRKITTYTYQDATGHHQAPYEYTNYARYWHGYQVVLKPLLCLFDYYQIRIINYLTLGALAIATILLLYKKVGKYAGLTLGLTLIISNFFIVPLAMQFSTCYYIAFISMLILLLTPKWTRSSNKEALFFFGIGACTSYFDLLTTPIITLGLPLIVLLLYQHLHVKQLAAYSFSWGAGYALLWITKWIIAWIFTDYNIMEDAIQAAEVRVGNTLYFGGVEMTFAQFFHIVLSKISSLLPTMAWYIILIAIIVGFIILIRKNLALIKKEKCLMCILLMPLLWFIALKNHSIQHIFFTWRDWTMSLWCILILISKSKLIYNKLKQQSTRQ